MTLRKLRSERRHSGARQRGAVAIMVGLSLLVLIGMVGLAVDSGQLYVNEDELQTAADSCALAAAQELTCQSGAGGGSIVTCAASFLQNAEAAGIYAAGKNKARLQSAAVTVAAADVRFSTTLGPNSGYQSRSGGANLNSRFAMCIARANGIAPWVMGVVGVGSANINATAVATLAPGQTFCSAAPMGICRIGAATAPNFGYTLGQWITGSFTGGNNANSTTDVVGGFRWVDFTPSGGGTDEVREQLYGRSQVCGIKVGDNVNEPGAKQGTKLAYNTRFGVYANASGESVTTAPPDRSGYAYPNKAPGSPVIAVGTSAYSDYVRRQGLNSVFTETEYDMTGNTVTGVDVVSTAVQNATYGTDRRLVAVPVIACGGGTEPILGMACVLMLNPMTKGANGTIYVEYRGNASDSSSPCRIVGGAGGPGNSGPLVPTLAQ